MLFATDTNSFSSEIKFVDLTSTMTIGNYVEQMERTKQTKESDLVYYGIVFIWRLGLRYPN
jgi:hypothetical protein